MSRRVVLYQSPAGIEAFTSIIELIKRYPELKEELTKIYYKVSKRKQPYIFGDITIQRVIVNGALSKEKFVKDDIVDIPDYESNNIIEPKAIIPELVLDEVDKAKISGNGKDYAEEVTVSQEINIENVVEESSTTTIKKPSPTKKSTTYDSVNDLFMELKERWEVYNINNLGFSITGLIPIENIPWFKCYDHFVDLGLLSGLNHVPIRKLRIGLEQQIFLDPRAVTFKSEYLQAKKEGDYIRFQISNVGWSNRYRFAGEEKPPVILKSKEQHLEFIKERYSVNDNTDGTFKIKGSIDKKMLYPVLFYNTTYDFAEMTNELRNSEAQTRKWLNKAIFNDEKAFIWETTKIKVIQTKTEFKFEINEVRLSDNKKLFAKKDV